MRKGKRWPCGLVRRGHRHSHRGLRGWGTGRRTRRPRTCGSSSPVSRRRSTRASPPTRRRRTSSRTSTSRSSKFGPPPQLKAVPAAAASWTVKGPNVTINLRKDLKWTNGQQVTAQDYVWSWLRTISPELGSDYAYQFFGIKGAEAYNGCDPKAANCNALRSQVGITAPSKLAIRVQLKAPQAWFIQQLNHTSFIPVPPGDDREVRGEVDRAGEHRQLRPLQACFLAARRFVDAGQEPEVA